MNTDEEERYPRGLNLSVSIGAPSVALNVFLGDLRALAALARTEQHRVHNPPHGEEDGTRHLR